MQRQLSDELYPIIDFTGQAPIGFTGGSKNFPVYKRDGNRYVLMEKLLENQFSEVALSKLARQLDIRAADNDFAVRGNNNAGVASKYFLEENEDYYDFCFENSHCNHTSRNDENIFQNADISMLHRICKENVAPLHQDFRKNLIESYLFSVLSCNYDHHTYFKDGHYHIMNLALTYNGISYNMAPYHDMERCTFIQHPSCCTEAVSQELEEICQEVLDGYQANIPNLRTKYRSIHDRFLDNLNRVDVKKLSDFNRPHLIRKIANGDAGFTEQLSDEFDKKLTRQIKLMKNYRSCYQGL